MPSATLTSRGVILTKLQCPSQRPGMLERDTLLRQVLASECKAVFLVAPAGYGKTVFLSQLADRCNRPVLWYSLDEHDNDPVTFFAHIGTLLNPHTPHYALAIRDQIASYESSSGFRRLLGFLTAALSEMSHLRPILILDNWHVITDPTVRSFFGELIRYMPRGSQLFVGSRSGNALKSCLAHLELIDDINVIRRDRLRFTKHEMELLAKQTPCFRGVDYKELEERTLGWPMAVAILYGERERPFLRFKTAEKCMDDYIEEEILAEECPSVLDFASKIAVFSRFTLAYCKRLVPASDAEDIVRYIEDKQLFISTAIDKDGEYSFDPLFRQCLLNQSVPNRAEIYETAGHIANDAGDWDQAIECFLAADQRQKALDVLRNSGSIERLQGRWRIVGEWLKSFSEEEIRTQPRLLLYQAQVEINRGELGAAQRHVKKAKSLFGIVNNQVEVGECQLLEARIARGRGAMLDSINMLIDAESTLANERCQFFLALEKSVIQFSSGRLKEAQETLEASLAEAEKGSDTYVLSSLMEGLGNVLYLRGECSRALAMFKRAISISPNGIMPGYNCQDLMVEIYDDWGELEQALTIAQRSLAVKEKMGLVECLPSTYIQIACIYVNTRDYDKAYMYYSKAVDYIRDHDGDGAYLALNLVFWARALSLQGNWIEARSKAEEAMAVAKTQPRLIRTSCQAVAGLIYARTGSMEEGRRLLERTAKTLRQIGFLKALSYCYQALAYLYYFVGNRDKSDSYIKRALRVAVKINDLQIFVTSYHLYYPILVRALELGTETTFLQRIFLRVGNPCLEHLLPLLRETNSAVKQKVIPVLSEIGGPRVVLELSALLEDEDPVVKGLARTAYKQITDKDVPPVPVTTNAPLRINILGPIRIFAEQRDITATKWRSKKVRDLLVYLAHQNEPTRKERIIEALWPAETIDRASVNFHTTLYRLRKILEHQNLPHLVLYGTDCYALKDDGYVTDLVEFEGLLKSASDKRATSEQKIELLKQALELYRGDYMEGLDYDWSMPRREELRYRYSQARLLLVRFYLEHNHFQNAIVDLLRLIQEDNLCEEYHSLLMFAYTKAGNRSAAQQQFKNLVRILEDELGIGPADETIQLHESLGLA